MRRLLLIMMSGLMAGAVVAQPACARQDATARTADASAEALYRSGRYEEALAALRNPADDAARRLLVRVLLEVGRYEQAEAAALNGATPADVAPALANVAGEALYMRGQRERAEAAFARAAESNARDALLARLNLALARWERGARAEAMRDFDGFIDVYNSGRTLSAAELTAVGTAVRHLGIDDAALFQDAVRAYEEAARRDPAYAEARLLEGELFLEKYNSTDASALFREVLNANPRHPRALLGMARAKAFDGTNEARAFVDSSLAVNPHFPDALTFSAQLLVGLEHYDSAHAAVQRALQVNPSHQPALAVLGAIQFLQGDRSGFDATRGRALALNPHTAGFDLVVAEMASQHRRYADAVDMARRGLQLDSTNWSAHALVGLTQLRLGDPDAARTALERSFAGDPYNVWVKNTLDLLDTYPRYVTHRTERFELFLHGDEADLLSLYMAELAEEAYEALAGRYGARPQVPVRVEVYPRHADFSVRTVGLSGLGALGVAFGNILAMDSPAAREEGAFNWGSTLWHEIAHAVTLEASEHRVPRWLTEGLSVLEERRARPGWGAALPMDFLVAIKLDRLLPVSQLNAGFVRPTYPGQVQHAYFQASLVAEFIEQERGDRALRDMLRAFARGHSSERVFRDVLRTEPAAFDARFDEWMRRRFERQLAAIEVADPARGAGRETEPHALGAVGGEFVHALTAARELLEQGQTTAAQRQAERAIALYPEHGGGGSAYRVLQRVHAQAGDIRAAAEALRSHVQYSESDYAAHIELADLLEQLDDRAGAADVLERAMYIHPYDPQIHTRMAELYSATGNHRKAVRERRAVLALNPVNRADALFRLALALESAGEREDARRQVLRSLETAPNFEEAQQLLLRLRGSRP